MSEMGETRNGFWDELRSLFSANERTEGVTEQEARYERRYSDWRIERFLDRHFSDYAHEFGILDGVSLELRAERVDLLERQAGELVTFVKGADEELRGLEGRVADLEKAGKRK